MDPQGGRRTARSGDDEPFAVTVQGRADRGEPVRISVAGDLDLFTAPRLRAVIDDAVAARARTVIVDLEATSALDSSGLVVLVTGYRQLRDRGGRLTLTFGDNADVARKLELTGLDQVLLRDALNSIG